MYVNIFVKRACFNLGIGRELYTAPKIFINLNANEWSDFQDKVKVKGSTIFTVAELGYDENRVINHLVIKDKNDKIRYKLGENIDEQLHAFALPAIQQATTTEELARIWKDYPTLQSNPTFVGALSAKKKEVTQAA